MTPRLGSTDAYGHSIAHSGGGYPKVGDVVTCPRCGGEATSWVDARDRHQGGRHTIHRCLRCGVGFAAGPVIPIDAAPTGLPATGPLRRVADAMLTAELRTVLDVTPPGGSIIDIGAGSGNRALLLARAGHVVTAVEPDADEAEAARRQLGAAAIVHQCAIEDLPPTGGPGYDTAVMSHVLEHLVDADAALRVTRTRLRIGGTLVVMVPNAGGAEARTFRGRWHGWEPARHRWHYTAPTLTQVLSECGYEQIDVRVSGGWRYPTTLAYSIAPGRDRQLHRTGAGLIGRAIAISLAPLAMLEVVAGVGPQLVATARRGSGEPARSSRPQ